MATLGICVGFTSNSRMTIRAVVLSGARTQPQVEHVFELKTGSDDLANQIDDLTRELRSRVSGLQVQRAVIRIADFSPRPSNRPGPRSRLMLEGALMFVLREVCPGEVKALDGKEIGQALGMPKKEAIKFGAELSEGSADAAAAALSGLS